MRPADADRPLAPVEADARETVRNAVDGAAFQKLERLVALCEVWGRVTNLVSRGDAHRLWSRHVADSLQLVSLADGSGPDWLDLGSGGGFPGLVVAIARPDTKVRLVEANHKKAAFLVKAAADLELPVVVEPRRIEDVPPRPADVVSARALAPLPVLLTLARPFFTPATLGLFPKGREADAEIAAARADHAFDAARHRSATAADAVIIAVRMPALPAASAVQP